MAAAAILSRSARRSRLLSLGPHNIDAARISVLKHGLGLGDGLPHRCRRLASACAAQVRSG
jgi:hypothetical protein